MVQNFKNRIMTSRLCILSIVILISILLSACEPIQNGSILDTEYEDLFQVAAYSAFGVSTAYRVMGFNRISILEKDSYGRTLFLYEDRSDVPFWFRKCSGLFVVQKSDNNTVWFYEDFCYKMWGANKGINWAYAETLKEQNDWGKPINEPKLSKLQYEGLDYCRSIPHSEDSDACEYIEGTSEAQQFLKEATPHEVRSLSYFYLCKDEANQQIFLLTGEVKRGESVFWGPYYIYLLRPDGSYECVEIKSPFDCNQELHDLKVKNNWSGMPQ